VVRRIFAEFVAGLGFFAIAEGLTRDGIPSPSAHDPERNKHRSGIAWNKFAVRAILINPATPATRCGTSSAKTNYSSTLRTSRLATRPSCGGTTPASGCGRRISFTL